MAIKGLTDPTTLRIRQLNDAIEAAKVFKTRAEEWKRALSNDDYAVFGSRAGGACKRASMELSQALIPLRKATPRG